MAIKEYNYIFKYILGPQTFWMVVYIQLCHHIKNWIAIVNAKTKVYTNIEI